MAHVIEYPAGTDVRGEDITVRQVISYGTVIYRQFVTPSWPRQLRMHIVAPNEKGPHPAIIYFTGGSFMRSNFFNFTQQRTALAQAGFVTASAEYSIVPHPFPALMEDAKAAVAYLRAHAAELYIDPDRIVAVGDSAGGLITQLLVTTSGTDRFVPATIAAADTRVTAGVSLFGVSYLAPQQLIAAARAQSNLDLAGPAAQFPAALAAMPPSLAAIARGFLQGTDEPRTNEDTLRAALEASAMYHVHAGEPPLYLLHGGEDSLVPPAQSVDMYAAGLEVGADVRLRILPGAEHGTVDWYQPGVIRELVEWCAAQTGWDTAYDPAHAPERIR